MVSSYIVLVVHVYEDGIKVKLVYPYDIVGSIRACRDAASRCEEAKFEQYKLVIGDGLTEAIKLQMHNYLEKIKLLEH